MQKQVLRSRHGNRALLSDHLRSIERRRYNLFLSALNHLGDETELERFLCRKLARSVRKLADKRLVTRSLGKTSERSYVGCQANIDFLIGIKYLLVLRAHMGNVFLWRRMSR